jgi:hypothetical protein
MQKNTKEKLKNNFESSLWEYLYNSISQITIEDNIGTKYLKIYFRHS